MPEKQYASILDLRPAVEYLLAHGMSPDEIKQQVNLATEDALSLVPPTRFYLLEWTDSLKESEKDKEAMAQASKEAAAKA